MNTFKSLDETLLSQAFEEHGIITSDTGESTGKALVIIREAPHSLETPEQALSDARYARSLMVHQNQVRALAHLVLVADPQSQLLTMNKQVDGNLPHADLRETYLFEKKHGERREIGKTAFRAIEKPFANIVDEEKAKISQNGNYSPGQEIYRSFAHVLGEARQTARTFIKDPKKITGYEVSAAQEGKLPSAIIFGSDATEICREEQRFQNLMEALRMKISRNSHGVIVVPALPKSGQPYRPLISNVKTKVPNTRIIVVEPLSLTQMMPKQIPPINTHSTIRALA